MVQYGTMVQCDHNIGLLGNNGNFNLRN